MRADLADDGNPADGAATASDLSLDGTKVAFGSHAANLVPGDTNGFGDVFVHDFSDGSTTRVSVATDGTQGDGDSGSSLYGWETPVAISSSGRYCAFESSATDLVPGDTNGLTDVFVRDVVTGTTTRVSVATDGTQADDLSRLVSISNGGRYVGFISSASDLTSDAPASGLYVHDIQTGATELASVAFDGSPVSVDLEAGMSADGRHVAFESLTAGVVANDTNGYWDVFERDLDAGVTTRVSLTSSGAQAIGSDPADYAPEGPALSAHGRYVAFISQATNLSRFDDKVGEPDLFVHDRKTGKTVQADRSSTGYRAADAADPVISDDGRFVGFGSGNYTIAPCGLNSHGVGYGNGFYVRDMAAGTTVRVSTYANGKAFGDIAGQLHLSGDGHVASFITYLNLDPGDTDAIPNVYLHDVVAPVGAPDASISSAGSVTQGGLGICNSALCSRGGP